MNVNSYCIGQDPQDVEWELEEDAFTELQFKDTFTQQ